MSGFEPGSSGIGSNRAFNCVTTTAPRLTVRFSFAVDIGPSRQSDSLFERCFRQTALHGANKDPNPCPTSFVIRIGDGATADAASYFDAHTSANGNDQPFRRSRHAGSGSSPGHTNLSSVCIDDANDGRTSTNIASHRSSNVRDSEPEDQAVVSARDGSAAAPTAGDGHGPDGSYLERQAGRTSTYGRLRAQDVNASGRRFIPIF